MKTRAEVRASYRDIKVRLNWVEGELALLQSECAHPSVVKEHKSNVGNYDPSNDCYWTVFDCPDCHKHWTEEGSK